MNLDERFRRTLSVHAWSFALALSIVTVVGCGADDSSGGGGAGGAAGAAGSGDAADMARPPADEGNSFVVAPPINAQACTANNQCSTGFCVDGVCCDVACDYSCMACTAAKKGSGVDGVCGSIAFDTDPDNECTDGACDGKNVCKGYNGATCSTAVQCLSKYCVDGYCCGNICMGECQACSAAKKGGGYNGACGNIATTTDPDNECNPGECNGSGACTAAQTKSANGAACISAAQCTSGYCADGVCCDSWCLGTCQACTAAKKGQGSDGTCGNMKYDADPEEECWGGSCDGAGLCKQYNGHSCSSAIQCLSGNCADGFCCGSACTGACSACSAAKKGQGNNGGCGPIAATKDPDNECNPGECNGSGGCNQPQTLQANGAVCVTSVQCVSGFCTDGVCCDRDCGNTCEACTAAKKGSGVNGTCGPIVSETNPDNECNGGRCDGFGACRYYNGAPCTSTGQCFSKYCVDGVCCGNVCTGSCQACSALKKGQGGDGSCGAIANTRDPDNECNPGECNGSGACNQSQTLQANGTACITSSQCISGFCADGVCCDTVCSGLCQACTATKKGSGTNGTCGNIKYDADPDNECYAGSCGGDGTCKQLNGLPCMTTAQCLSNYCVDGVCCGGGCTGTCMACSAAKKGGGYDGGCGPIAVDTDPDNECGLTCNGAGQCAAPTGQACTSGNDCISAICINNVCAAPGPVNGPLAWLTALHTVPNPFAGKVGLHDIAVRDDGTVISTGQFEAPLRLPGYDLPHPLYWTELPLEINLSSTGTPTSVKNPGVYMDREDRFNGPNVWIAGGDVVYHYVHYPANYPLDGTWGCDSAYLKKFAAPTWTKDPCAYQPDFMFNPSFVVRVAGDSAGNVLVRWDDHWVKYKPNGAQSFTIPEYGTPFRYGALGAGDDIYWVDRWQDPILRLKKTGFGGSAIWDQTFPTAIAYEQQSIAVDASGNILVAFNFGGTVDLGNGPMTATGTYDLALAKFDPAGNVIWSKHFGGPGFDLKRLEMKLTGTHDMAVVGHFDGSVDFGSGGLSGSAFVAKFDTLGNIVWQVDLVDALPALGDYDRIKLSGHPSGAVFIASASRALDFGSGPILDNVYGFLVAKYGGF